MGHDSNHIFEADTPKANQPSTHYQSCAIPKHRSELLDSRHEPGTVPKRAQASPAKLLACSSSPSIMIVGCDNGLRSLLRAYLQHVGFEVIGCSDLEGAYRALVSGRLVQLLLVDSQMLAESSPGIRESIADQYPDVAVFVISGKRMTDGTLREIKHRIWEPDSQPFLLPELLGRIQASLENGFHFEPEGVRAASEHSDKVVSISAGDRLTGIRPAFGQG